MRAECTPPSTRLEVRSLVLATRNIPSQIAQARCLERAAGEKALHPKRSQSKFARHPGGLEYRERLKRQHEL